MDVGRARLVGVDDDLAGEPDDRAVVLVELARAHVERLGDVFGAQIAEDRADRVLRGRLAAGLAEEEQDVLPQPDCPLDLPVLQRLADAVHPLQVLRVVDDDQDAVVLAAERHPDVTPQVLDPQILHEIGRRDDPLVVLDERAPVELAQRDAQLVLRDLVLLDQDRLHVGLAAPRFGDRRVQLVLRDPVLRQQVVELGLGPVLALEQLGLIVERDAERLGDPRDAGLVVLGEPGALLLVQELDHADRPALVEHGHGQDLLRPEARLLVPRAVEAQDRRDHHQLGPVVGVGDVHDLAGGRDEAGDALLVDRNPDFLDGVEREELRVELLLARIDRVERHPVGVEKAQDLALELDEEAVDALGRVDPVHELDELLLVGETLL